MFLCLSPVELHHYFTLINTQKQVNGILRGVQGNEDGCAWNEQPGTSSRYLAAELGDSCTGRFKIQAAGVLQACRNTGARNVSG
jgi:hypothetical protein